MIDNDFVERLRRLTPARIRAARLELKLGQEGFATLVSKRARIQAQRPSVFTVSRWETGKKQPGMLWGPALVAIVEESEARRAHQATASERPALAQVGGHQ